MTSLNVVELENKLTELEKNYQENNKILTKLYFQFNTLNIIKPKKENMTDLSELNIELNKLTEKILQLNEIHKNQHLVLHKLCLNFNKFNYLEKEIEKEIKLIKNSIAMTNVYNLIKKIHNITLLSKDETNVIFDGINNTTDCDKWLNLERIIKKAIEFKSHHSDWVLLKIEPIWKHHSDKTLYKFWYKTDQWGMFTIHEPILRYKCDV